MSEAQDAAETRTASTHLSENPIPPEHRSTVPVRTHDEKVELYLKTIAWCTGIVAAAVIANFIAAIAIGVAAGAHGIGY